MNNGKTRKTLSLLLVLLLLLKQLSLGSVRFQHLPDELQPAAQGVLLVIVQPAQKGKSQHRAQRTHQLRRQPEKATCLFHAPTPCHFSATVV
mgnify:CR=1 FL=1